MAKILTDNWHLYPPPPPPPIQTLTHVHSIIEQVTILSFIHLL